MTARKTTRIDMHVHTRGSDGSGTAAQILRAAKRAQLDGLCITDHHLTVTAEGAEVARACRDSGLLVFRGCEYSTADGHLLIYGVDVEDLGLGCYPPMQYAIDCVLEAGGYAVPAHPYKSYQRALRDKVKLLRRVRAYETLNGQCLVQRPGVNEKAQEAAKAKGRLGIGGSDAHYPEYVGVAYTVFEGRVEDEKSLVQTLSHGLYRAQAARGRADSLASAWTRARARREKLIPRSLAGPDLDLPGSLPSLDSIIEKWRAGSLQARSSNDDASGQSDFWERFS